MSGKTSEQLKKLHKSIYESIPSLAFCKLINFRNKTRKKKHRLQIIEGKNLYKIIDHNSENIIICRRSRHNLYKRGINHRLESLAAAYHLDKIECNAGDVLIDCGANVGELGMWANTKKLHYIPVEPEELEVECCNLNVFHGKGELKCKALWKENTSLQLYSKPNSADSSLFEVSNYSSTKTVEALRLDKLMEEYNIDKIHILKIEAEGAEPEILQGADSVLNKVNYVAVDCGYERGLSQEHTFIDVNNILLKSGFKLVQAELKRGTMLYQNRNLG